MDRLCAKEEKATESGTCFLQWINPFPPFCCCHLFKLLWAVIWPMALAAILLILTHANVFPTQMPEWFSLNCRSDYITPSSKIPVVPTEESPKFSACIPSPLWCGSYLPFHSYPSQAPLSVRYKCWGNKCPWVKSKDMD